MTIYGRLPFTLAISYCSYLCTSLYHLCTIFEPSLYHLCTIFVHLCISLHNCCTIFVQSLYNLCTIFAQSLHHLCTIFVPSLYIFVHLATAGPWASSRTSVDKAATRRGVGITPNPLPTQPPSPPPEEGTYRTTAFKDVQRCAKTDRNLWPRR